MPGRRVTALAPSGDTVLVHDAALALDRGLEKAVARALRLTTDHVRLRAEAYEQLGELRSCRTRLVLARGRQQVVLARRIRETVDRRFAALDALLTEIGSSDDAVDHTVERARGHLRGARESIAALAQGLQPPVLAADGLGGALRSVAADSPVAATVTVDERRFDAAIEHAAYLVCSEALANVAKQAHATRAALRVEATDGWLRLEVSDDGRGGADLGGSGLRGISARVEELGGPSCLAQSIGAWNPPCGRDTASCPPGRERAEGARAREVGVGGRGMSAGRRLLRPGAAALGAVGASAAIVIARSGANAGRASPGPRGPRRWRRLPLLSRSSPPWH